MRSETLIRSLDITAHIESFLSSGGQVKTAPYGNAVNDNDGESWQQQNRRRWAARQERSAANE